MSWSESLSRVGRLVCGRAVVTLPVHTVEDDLRGWGAADIKNKHMHERRQQQPFESMRNSDTPSVSSNLIVLLFHQSKSLGFFVSNSRIKPTCVSPGGFWGTGVGQVRPIRNISLPRPCTRSPTVGKFVSDNGCRALTGSPDGGLFWVGEPGQKPGRAGEYRSKTSCS